MRTAAHNNSSSDKHAIITRALWMIILFALIGVISRAQADMQLTYSVNDLIRLELVPLAGPCVLSHCSNDSVTNIYLADIYHGADSCLIANSLKSRVFGMWAPLLVGIPIRTHTPLHPIHYTFHSNSLSHSTPHTLTLQTTSDITTHTFATHIHQPTTTITHPRSSK